TGWLEEEIRREADDLAKAGKIRVVSKQPLLLVLADRFAELKESLAGEVDLIHKANPLAPGISREDLRARAAPRVREEVFRAALEALVADKKLVVAGESVKRAGQEITLLPEEARAKDQIEGAFSVAGLKVPSLEEVLAKLPVEKARAQRLLQILLREQKLVKVTEGLVFHRTALDSLRGMLAEYKKSKGSRLPIGTFKDLTGVTRKYAIPLLEYLDRERVTRRVGDERAIL
ncbi:MAG TPA: SelB C-terminal domain-containing protein, partial [Candidatus Acidoferrales bacterium]|nr:SelB C-terminal domain-containing protein [Candidatus Acidoferrales bacterium]